MDEAVMKYYKRLLKTGFNNAGSLDNPSIFLNYNNRTGSCGKTGTSFQFYINTSSGVIEQIKYLCICDPTVNVIIEVLCDLVRGQSITEAKNLNEGVFARIVGSQGDEFLKRTQFVLDFLRQGLRKLQTRPGLFYSKASSSG